MTDYGTYHGTGPASGVPSSLADFSEATPLSAAAKLGKVQKQMSSTLDGIHEVLRMFGKNAAGNIAVFIFLPWAIFTLVMILFALGFRHLASFAWLLFIVSVTCSVGLIGLSTKINAYGRPGVYWRALGLLCFAATMMGMSLGLYDYLRYAAVYYTYEVSHMYTNVLPTEDPGAMMDAGIITFSGDAYVDYTLSIGYRSDQLFCVAPIFNTIASAEPVVLAGAAREANFFAVGLDCCHETGHFECGPVLDKTVKGGLRAMDASPLERAKVPTFLVAARKVGSTYGLTVPDDVIFVQWSGNPGDGQNYFWDQGVQFYLRAVLIYIIVMLCAGILATLYMTQLSKIISLVPIN